MNMNQIWMAFVTIFILLGCFVLLKALFPKHKRKTRQDSSYSDTSTSEDESPRRGLTGGNLALISAPKGIRFKEVSSPYVKIISADQALSYLVKKADLMEYNIPCKEGGEIHVVSLQETDPYTKRLWFCVKDTDEGLRIIAEADSLHPGLVRAFELINYYAGSTESPPEEVKALWKSFGWGMEDRSGGVDITLP